MIDYRSDFTGENTSGGFMDENNLILTQVILDKQPLPNNQ